MIASGGIILLSTTTLAKYLKHIPTGEYLFLRFVFALVFILPTLCFQQPTIDMKGKFKLILARCILGSVNALCKFWAVIKLDYGNAIALCACAPVFAALFSRVLWKEKINFEEVAIKNTSKIADGSMRDALSITEQCISHGDNKITYDNICKILCRIWWY